VVELTAKHYAWDTPDHVPATDNALSVQDDTPIDIAMSANNQAASQKPELAPATKAVTAARNAEATGRSSTRAPLPRAGGYGDNNI
jgi:hypothetical protein